MTTLSTILAFLLKFYSGMVALRLHFSCIGIAYDRIKSKPLLTFNGFINVSIP